MIKKTIAYVYIIFLLFLSACGEPTEKTKSELDEGVFLPPWLSVKLSFEKLPDVQKPALLIFDVTYVGEEGQPLTTLEGDTMDYLWLGFATDRKTELLDADADSVWHGRVEVEQTIHLEYEFHLTDAENDACCKSDSSFFACHLITLFGRFFTTQQTLSKNDTMRSYTGTNASLLFNHLSGEYTFRSPYEVSQGDHP